MIRYSLPFPPSVNNLFANGKAGRFRTEHYRRWVLRQAVEDYQRAAERKSA